MKITKKQISVAKEQLNKAGININKDYLVKQAINFGVDKLITEYKAFMGSLTKRAQKYLEEWEGLKVVEPIASDLEKLGDMVKKFNDLVDDTLETLDEYFNEGIVDDFKEAIGYKGPCMGDDISRIVASHIMAITNIKETKVAKANYYKQFSKEALLNKVIAFEMKEEGYEDSNN